MPTKGTLTVITGPMVSNKSGELLRQATVHRIAGRRVGLFKHDLDDRYEGAATISTHDGQTMPAEPVSSSVQLGIFAADLDLVAIDEGQFFDDGLAEVAAGLVGQGLTVIVAGLDRNFKGEPFGPMPLLLAHAAEVMKLKAVCMKCRSLNGTMTQRLIDGKPAPRSSPLILIGAADSYE